MAAGSERRPGRSGEAPARPSFEDWLELERGLLLEGAELSRRPGLSAWRDRRHPRLWDRQVVVSDRPPEPPGREIDALDRYYLEARASQWSWLGGIGPVAEAWADELLPRGALAEGLAYLGREPRPAEPDPGVLVVGGEEMPRLERLRRSLYEGAAAGAVVRELGEVLGLRTVSAWPPVVLAVAGPDGHAVAAVTVTVVRGLGWIEDLETHPDWRERGLGRRLLRAAEARARAAGAARVGLSARGEDWPAGWYRREGYAPLGEALRLRRSL